MSTIQGSIMGNLVTEYRRFIPQVSYVALAVLAVAAKATQDHTSLLNGLSIWTLVVAGVQAIAVYAPSNVVAKILVSFVAAIGQVMVSAWTDNVITSAEWLMIAVAFFTWAQSGVAINYPRGQYVTVHAAQGTQLNINTAPSTL